MKDFGERLKELRKKSNITQAELAEKLNVHLQTISKWERGKSEPDISQMGELAKVLGVTLEKLFGGDENKQTYDGTFSAENLGSLLSSLRTSNNESQEQLAQTLNVSADAISRWERGITCPDIEKLFTLSLHYKLPVSKLYYGINEESHTASIVRKKKSKQSIFIWLSSIVAVLSICALFLVLFLPRAKSVPVVYTVVFDEEEFAVNENDWFMPQTPVREGYEFTGWKDEDGNIVNFPLKITSNSKYTSSFALLPQSEKYTVTLEDKKYEVNQDEWFVADKPEKVGYDFVCWLDENGKEVAFPRKITADCSYLAKYSAREYSIDYWLNGGNFVTSEVQNVFTVESGSVNLPVPEKIGATFEGWYLLNDYSDNAVEQLTCNAEHVKLYAKWSDNTYTVRYELNGGILYDSNPFTVTADNEIVLNNPIRKGYLFLGWYDYLNADEQYVAVGGNNAKNLTLTAVWQKSDAVFNIEYYLDGGVLSGINPEEVNAGERHLLNNAHKTGYDFIGWNSKADGTGEFYQYLLGIQSNLKLYAIYEAKQYLIRYEYDGVYESGTTNPNYITFGEEITLNPVVKYGYYFTGWYDDAINGTLIAVIDESNILDINILYARFSPIIYSITLDADGGIISTPDGERNEYTYELKFDEKLILPESTKGGYIFLGWLNEEGDIVTEINSLNIANMLLTAKWRESDKRYSVTYELDGGMLEEENPVSVLCGQVIHLNEPVREHYIFLGWYDDAEGNGNKYEFTSADRESDLNLYAIWQEIKVSGSSKDFIYEKNTASGTVTITGYKGEYGENVDLVVPSVIDGLPVVEIQGEHTDYTQQKSFKSITIPEGIIKLGEDAFHRCNVTEPLVIPSSVKEIGTHCFSDSDYSEITFAPESKLQIIGECAFVGCEIRCILKLPEGLISIERQAFGYGVYMYGIILPSTLQRIDVGGLNFRDGMNSIVNGIYIPASVTYVGERGINPGAGKVYFAGSQEDTKNFSPLWCGYGGEPSNYSIFSVKPATVTLSYGENSCQLTGNVFELPSPEINGKTFMGWKDENGDFVSRYYLTDIDKTLYAVYEDISSDDGREKDRMALFNAMQQYNIMLRCDEDSFYFKLNVEKEVTITITSIELQQHDRGAGLIYVNKYGNADWLSSGDAVNYSPEGYFIIRSNRLPTVFRINIFYSI